MQKHLQSTSHPSELTGSFLEDKVLIIQADSKNAGLYNLYIHKSDSCLRGGWWGLTGEGWMMEASRSEGLEFTNIHQLLNQVLTWVLYVLWRETHGECKSVTLNSSWHYKDYFNERPMEIPTPPSPKPWIWVDLVTLYNLINLCSKKNSNKDYEDKSFVG